MIFPSFSIIIPIFNENKNIVSLLRKIISSNRYLKYEIIIIDDSSTDGSQNVIEKFIKKKSYIKLIKRTKYPRDLSLSCIKGFEKSKNKLILVMDGDGQHHPKYIRQMIKKMNNQNLDFVIGTRNLFSKKFEGLSFLRKKSSQLIIILINFLFGNITKDPMSGFFIFRKKIYLENKHKLYKKGYKILFDLITSKKNLNISDINIKFLRRGEGQSKMSLKIIIILVFQIIYKLIKK
tara:strand:+ start:2334 stop:3038 length:705 start_codon:yes stop_codon:yes gene_type:complete